MLVDAIALRRGYAAPTETCEIAGTGTPVSVGWIDDRLPTAAVDVLVHDRVDIRAHAIVHRRRRRPDDDLPAEERPTVVVLVDAPSVAALDADEPRIAVPDSHLQMSIARLRRLVPADVAQAIERNMVDIRRYRSATRHTPRPVRLAIAARDRTCTVPGCRRRQRLERDHIHDHALGGTADTRNIHGLCDDHHDDKTYRDAHVVTTATERLWYPAPDEHDRGAGPTIPWRAPLGEHLDPWDVSDLPAPALPSE